MSFGLALRVELESSDLAGGGFDRLCDLAEALDGELDGLYLAAAPGSSIEPFVLLGAIAERTSTLRLGELATRVDRRTPSLVPKLVSTLDVLSVGRADAVLAPPRLGSFGIAPVGLLRESVEIVRALLRVPAPRLLTPHFRIDGAWNEPARGASAPVPLGLLIEATNFAEEAENGEKLASELLGLAARLCERCLIALDASYDIAEVHAELMFHVVRAGRRETDIGVWGCVGLEAFESRPEMASELSVLGFDALVLDTSRLTDAPVGRVVAATEALRAAILT